MRLLLAVAEDLILFAWDALCALVGYKEEALKEIPHTPVLPAPSPKVAIPEATLTRLEHERLLASSEETRREVKKNAVMYTASIFAPLRSVPDMRGDTVTATLPYGSMAMVLDAQDGWAYVASGEHKGWIHVEDLEDRAAHVYPAFHIGEPNRDDDPSTIRLRALIADEFGAGEANLPLQAEEYVLYRLYKRGVRPSWPAIRPRTPGSWHTILRGHGHIRMEGEPVSGSVMEFSLGGEEGTTPLGHLAYVEAVFPDGSIQVSEANWPDQGIYNERVLVPEEWKSLTPTFIVF